ncbi:hypothetical protein GF389_03670 [Candidatus Dojkabacteria bacterium]|nr:hypothetical protein [Candidatus Dojkabacteria bacterium]
MLVLELIINWLYNLSKGIPIVKKYVTKRFLRYLFVGGTSFLLTYSINSILILFINLETRRSDTYRSAYVSVSFIIAYIITFVYNFSLSQSWTFKVSRKNYYSQLSKFFTVHAVTLIVATVLISTLDRSGVSPFISLPYIAVIQMCTGYFFYKTWVFKIKKKI